MEWDMEGTDGDRIEDFGICSTQGSASRSRRQREEEECMEGVRRGVLGGAYVKKPRRSGLDVEEEMAVAAVGIHVGRLWELWSTSRLAFMVSHAVDAAVWEDLN